MTLLSTLLPPRTRDVRPAPSGGPLKSLGFVAGTGRILAAGSGYAAVWDMVSPEVREGGGERERERRERQERNKLSDWLDWGMTGLRYVAYISK